MIDEIEREVLRGRLDSLAEEMQVTLQRSAFSSVVKEGADASAAIFTRDGELLAQANALPVHLGSIEPAVRELVRRFPAETLGAGDALLTNDPYAGGQHLPDIILVLPIVVDGAVVGFAGSMTHHQDVGGKAPGSTPTDATELFQEGLRIPPLKLDETVLAFLRANVRVPDAVEGDLRAQIAAARAGARGIAELCHQYGVDTYLHATQELLAIAERLCRAALAELPQGTWVFDDYLDNDGIDLDHRIRIRAAVTLRGDGAVEYDLTGSAPQVRGPLNAVPSVALSAVRYVTRILAGADVPNNAGCYRPIRLTLPEASVVNPELPAAVNARAVTLRRIVDACMGALAQVIPERLTAASNGHPLMLSLGGSDGGIRFVTSIVGTGGMGARATKDGIDCIQTETSNAMLIPVEAIELDYPLRLERLALRNDSGGAGRQRGGLGLELVVRSLIDDCRVSYRGERHATQPWGVEGGRPGASSVAYVARASGTREVIQSKRDFVLNRDEALHIFTSGGGGYGDPRERDRGLIEADLADGKISAEYSRAEHGATHQR